MLLSIAFKWRAVVNQTAFTRVSTSSRRPDIWLGSSDAAGAAACVVATQERCMRHVEGVCSSRVRAAAVRGACLLRVFTVMRGGS